MTSSIVALYGRDPFLVLISCLLSLRTKDTLTLPISIELFKHAKTPHEILSIPLNALTELIYPVGFYKKKALVLRSVSRDLINRFNGTVPSTQEELLSIKGVGPKTAALVLGEAFGIPAICVDTHVHRISNRLGLVQTKNPVETQKALEILLPKEYWIEFNRLLAIWGQNICVPISPFCSKCSVYDLCERKGVTKKR